MSLFVAIILGLLQGITEFLPVSSSGHVLIFSRILQNPSSFEFDVLVSFGTLFAVIIYYRVRLMEMARDLFVRKDPGLVLKLIVATLPAVAVGFFFKDLIELYLHGPITVIVMLFTIGVLMVLSSRWLPKKELPVNSNLHNITYRQTLIMGLAQSVSLISGSSRSGVTILAALKMGFKKRVAAEWSFLMSIPAIGGASLRVLLSPEGLTFVREETMVFIIANVVAFISGLAAIHVLLVLLQKKGLYWFGWYRIVLAAVLMVLLSASII